VAVLIDTSVFVEVERSGSPVDGLVEEPSAISVITVSELLHGVHRSAGARRTDRQAFVERVISTFEPIPITETVARVHADVGARLAAEGAIVATHDLWIAATALTHGFGVVTRDENDFRRIPGLRVLAAP
jgi:predicted nucleic acid-binding protein